MQYRGHIFFESVRPHEMQQLLQNLKIYNHTMMLQQIFLILPATCFQEIATHQCIFLDITVDVDHLIPNEICRPQSGLHSSHKNKKALSQFYHKKYFIFMLRNKQQTDAHSNHVDDGEFIHSGIERIKNPLDQHRLPANETTLIISIPFVEKATVIRRRIYSIIFY